MPPVFALLVLSASILWAERDLPVPFSVAETPAMQKAQSLAESTAAAPLALQTTAERSNYTETGRYNEAVALYRKLAQASPLAQLVPAGQTAEGRPLYLFIVSKDRAFTPAAAARTGKPVVLLQNGIHPGENGGKDAAIMLLRDVLVTRKHVRWLDNVILLSIPVFNVDGHERVSPYNRINENGPREMGFRVTAQRLNLNRDYTKADTPEMRAWLKIYTAWLPDFLIDNHVTDGSDNPYDVTIATHTEQDVGADVGGWMKQFYVAPMMKAMEADGHVVGWYGGGAGNQETFPVMTASPRFSTGYAAAQSRAALLVETHSLKSFKTRTWAHYDIMRHTLDIVSANAAQLKQASRSADAALAALTPGAKVFLEGRPGKQSEPYTIRRLEIERYPGSVAGAPIARYSAKPLEVETKLVRSLEPRLEVAAPLGYLVPREWSNVIDLLKVHGIRMEVLPQNVTAELDTVRLEQPQFSASPFEGRFLVSSFTPRPWKLRRVYAAGSVFVPIAQRSARLVMHLLEPEAADSLVRWNFFPSIFEQKEYFSDYIFEPIAEQLLKNDPALQAEFDRKVAADSAFAKNPRARLAWVFERSPFFESDKGVYPVARVITRQW